MDNESFHEAFLCKTVRFDVPAAGEPKPALKYRLFPPRFVCKVGNAAPLYRKAFEMAEALEKNDGDRFESMRLLTIRDEKSRREEWGENIPPELSPEEVARFFADYTELFALLDEAAFCAECDWELALEDLSWWNSEGFHNFLPVVYQIACLLEIRVSYALQQEDIGLVFRSIQDLYALSANLFHAPMGVCAIVAVGMASSAASCVADLITSGKSPNLYWALTQLPRFSSYCLHVIESDRNGFFTDYPQLREIDDPARDEDHGYWREFGERFLVAIQGHHDFEVEAQTFKEIKAEMGEGEGESLTLEEAIEQLRQEYLESAVEDCKDDPGGFEAYKKTLYPADPQTILDELPTIKQTVLDGGYPPERIERLCAEQVIAIYAVHVHEELWDEVTKWCGVDFVTCQRFWEGVGGEKIKQTIEAYGTKLARMIAEAYIDSMGQAVIYGADEQTDALRIVEAIRLYAASHQGKLPRKLDKITEVPIPLSPLTGEPFRYKVERMEEGRVAVLEFTSNVYQEHRYEIRIV